MADMEELFSAERERVEESVKRQLRIAELVGPIVEEPIEFGDGSMVIPGMGLDETAHTIRRSANDLRRGLFTVLVYGEFKSGKSTFVNAVLGDAVLPANGTPTTAIIQVVEYGSSTDVEVYRSSAVEPERLTWQDFVDLYSLNENDFDVIDNDGVIDRFADVSYALIQREHPLLAYFIKLVDSPGLGEATSRTRTTETFLPQAHAVIVMINAVHSLGTGEKAAIRELFGSARYNHIFFVVNRLNQLRDDADRVKIMRRVRGFLEQFFRSEEGELNDDLLNRRLFGIDAEAALNARIAEPSVDAVVESSGIQAFEREFIDYIASHERVTTALRKSFEDANKAINLGHATAADRVASWRLPLDLLVARRSIASDQLEDLEFGEFPTSSIPEIVRTRRGLSKIVSSTLQANLVRSIGEWEANWAQDIREHTRLEELLTPTRIAGAVFPGGRETLAAEIQGELRKYMKVKLHQWGVGAPMLVMGEYRDNTNHVHRMIAEFNQELEDVRSTFYGLEIERGGESTESDDDFSALSVELSSMPGIGLVDGGMIAFIVRQIVISVVSAVIITTFMTGGLAFVVWLIAGLIGMGHNVDLYRSRAIERLGNDFFHELPGAIDLGWSEIRVAATKEIEADANRIELMLKSKIAELRRDMDEVVETGRKAGAAQETEIERLEAICVELTRIHSELGLIVNGV